MKTKAYILGVIYLALLILGLVQIGINAPQGHPPTTINWLKMKQNV